MPNTISKVWGEEIIHVNTRHYCMKTLKLNTGYMSSLHYHKKKDETFLCVSGLVLVEHGQKQSDIQTTILTPGMSIRLVPGTIHRFRAISQNGAVLVEASTHHSDKDVVRLVPSKEIKD